MKIKSNILIYLFFGIILIFLLLFLLLPKHTFSQQENRVLQEKPELKASDVTAGVFMEHTDRYIADHFPLRDTWITVKAACEYAAGKRNSNGIYYGKDGQLFPQFNVPDYSKLAQKIEWINSWSSSVSAPVSLCLIPSATDIQGDRLPAHTVSTAEEDAIRFCYDNLSGPQAIDLRPVLTEHKNEKIYYRTDHHWTSYGAKLAFDTLQDHLYYAQHSDTSNLNATTVCDDFYGTSYSSSGYTWVHPDTIETYIDGNCASVESFVAGIWNEPQSSGLYDETKLNGKDKYSYFLGGISPLIHIHNSDLSPSSLLLIRDSYSDSIAPFLSQTYSDIYLVDLRYYKDSIQQFILEHPVNEILIMYSMKNFTEDNNLGLLIG